MVYSLWGCFFTVTAFHTCSKEGKDSTYKSQGGQRLLYQLNKEGLSKNIKEINGFKYYRIEVTLSGDKEIYQSFLERNNYFEINNGDYCKDKNLIELKSNKNNTLLKYRYNSEKCINAQ
ncbi:hypothetical protein C3007_09205 [Avibacterium gallinarum]|uniref:hypothetical protein n=1 Tax=Avibacterium gallinarum TaxID=755 RepID=UPI000CDDDE7F|nr:hypothetical protein [Avibacterium gallinarum]POY43571.1 hypothetical protein C3007_09205 [Avibacterium gallinarum]